MIEHTTSSPANSQVTGSSPQRTPPPGGPTRFISAKSAAAVLDTHSEVTRRSRTTSHPFSKRQIQIMRLLGLGLTTGEIADDLHISVDTVRTHRQHILTRTALPNMMALVVACARQGWI